MLSMSVSNESGALNPEWVEWLMGWIPGFTSLEPLDNHWMNKWNSFMYDKIIGIQKDTEAVRGKELQRVRIGKECSPAPSGHGPHEHGCEQHSNPLPEMPREGARSHGNGEKRKVEALRYLRESVQTSKEQGWKGLFAGVHEGDGCGIGEEKVDEPLLGFDLRVLREDIHSGKSEAKDVFEVLRKQAVVEAAWWSEEFGIERVLSGVKNRSSRLRCIGNGQVPLCAAMAWRILSKMA